MYWDWSKLHMVSLPQTLTKPLGPENYSANEKGNFAQKKLGSLIGYQIWFMFLPKHKEHQQVILLHGGQYNLQLVFYYGEDILTVPR